MNQGLLFEEMPSKPTGHPLFIAMMPSEGARREIVAIATQQRVTRCPGGRLRSAETLHMTICDFKNSRDSYDSTVSAALKACESASRSTGTFPIIMDRILSVGGGGGGYGLALKSRAIPEELVALRKSLTDGFVKLGHKPDFSSGKTPHITMLYDWSRIAEEAIEPLAWMASELALIHSHVGENRYSILGQWSLQG